MIRYRPILEDEIQLLDDFLYLAIHQEDPANPVSRSVLDVPEVAAYTAGWGKPDDFCIVAVDDDAAGGSTLVGAAWARIIIGETVGYGNLNEKTPEYRGAGIGGELMRRLIRLLAEQGYAQASLSVQKSNPAHRLYERLGFSVVREQDGDYLMVIEPKAFLMGEVNSRHSNDS